MNFVDFELPSLLQITGSVESTTEETNGTICVADSKEFCNLSVPQITKQATSKPYTCLVCMKTYTSKVSLMTHMRIHTDTGYQCEVCMRKFSTKASRDIHYRSHNGQKPFKCDRCDKAFATNGNLKTHMLTHSSDKPFRCHVCPGKSFKTKVGLRQHMKFHQKPQHICHICGKSYHTAGNLNSHQMKHFVTHSCYICHLVFNSKREYNKHLKSCPQSANC